MIRARSLSLLLAWLVVFAAVPPAFAGVGDYRCSDASKVYFGNSRLFQRPAVIDCDKVYAHIPEYKEIVRRGLTAKSPRYHLLMKKATERFSAAVQKMARAKNHDLVALIGAVQKAKKTAKDIPDRTQDVIRKID